MDRNARRLILEPLEDRTLLATCTVNTLWDFGKGGKSFDPEQVAGDLRFCIHHANTIPGPDVIDFDVTGTINLRKPLPDLVTDIDIQGPGSHLLTVRRDTGGDYRIFTVSAGAVTLRGLTVTNGKSEVGGGIYTQADLTLEDVSVTSNTSTAGQGGGIYNAGTLAMTLSTISANTSIGPSAGYGGGIYNTEFGQSTISSSNVTGNLATGSIKPWSAYGGGIYNDGALTINDSGVIDNDAVTKCSTSSCVGDFKAVGGGVYNDGTLTLNNTSVNGNSTIMDFESNCFSAGGGIYNNAGTLEIHGGFVSGNLAGAYYCHHGVVNGLGGGIYNSAMGEAIIDSAAIIDNIARTDSVLGAFATGAGGGIYNAGILDLNASTIANNQVDAKTLINEIYARGGGIENSGILTIQQSTISTNTAMSCMYEMDGSPRSFGGGISHTGGTATIVSSTISSNVNKSIVLGWEYSDTYARGGGVFASAPMTILHSTIAQNVIVPDAPGTWAGAGISGNITIRNSIVAGNSGAASADLDGALVSSGYNLFSNTNGGNGYAPTDLLNVNPMLGSLADNGGPTRTHALQPGSPAIEAGDNTDAPEFDQRGPGFPRIVNGTIDMGAFEVQSGLAPSPPKFLAFLITAKSKTDE